MWASLTSCAICGLCRRPTRRIAQLPRTAHPAPTLPPWRLSAPAASFAAPLRVFTHSMRSSALLCTNGHDPWRARPRMSSHLCPCPDNCACWHAVRSARVLCMAGTPRCGETSRTTTCAAAATCCDRSPRHPERCAGTRRTRHPCHPCFAGCWLLLGVCQSGARILLRDRSRVCQACVPDMRRARPGDGSSRRGRRGKLPVGSPGQGKWLLRCDIAVLIEASK